LRCGLVPRALAGGSATHLEEARAVKLEWLGQQAEVPRKSAVPLALAIAGPGLIIFFATLRQVHE